MKIRGTRMDAQGATGPTRDQVVRRWILWGGTCQGVGFRYTAMDLANQLGLTGWARNNPDGTVEMEVQGPAGQIARFLSGMPNAYRKLRTIKFWVEDMKEEPVDPTETSFRVRY